MKFNLVIDTETEDYRQSYASLACALGALEEQNVKIVSVEEPAKATTNAAYLPGHGVGCRMRRGSVNELCTCGPVPR